MLTALVVLLISVGVLIGCSISPVSKPRDVSQPDQCDPKGFCNTGKPTSSRKLLAEEIRTSFLTEGVKVKLLKDLGESR